jgi:hypothetical protein
MYEKRILLGFMRVHILHHATEDEGIYGGKSSSATDIGSARALSIPSFTRWRRVDC